MEEFITDERTGLRYENAVGTEDEQHPQCCYVNRFE